MQTCKAEKCSLPLYGYAMNVILKGNNTEDIILSFNHLSYVFDQTNQLLSHDISS
jgi:hypothetical protein